MNEDYMFEDESIHEENVEIPPYYPQPRNNMGVAVASFVLGIFSLVFFLTFINGITAVLAIIFGIIFLARQRGRGRQGKAFAIIGMISAVTSIAVLMISVSSIISNIDHVIPLYNDIIKTYGLEDEYNYIEVEDGIYYIPEDINQQ